jgi:hypothetical protein
MKNELRQAHFFYMIIGVIMLIGSIRILIEQLDLWEFKEPLFPNTGILSIGITIFLIIVSLFFIFIHKIIKDNEE